jgi:uncharacterized membrane protein YheB (UPF0754 family)
MFKDKLVYYILIAIVIYFIYTQFFTNLVRENFSDIYVKSHCNTIKGSLDNINKYLDKYCRNDKHKTINEEMDCRYYNDKLIYMQTNKNSWCDAPTRNQITEKTPEELKKYLQQEVEQSDRVNNYYDMYVVNDNKVNYGNEMGVRKNPYKWNIPLSNDKHEPEPIERQFPYTITEKNQWKLTTMNPYVTGLDQ